jgi:hypothetical protein
VITKIIKASRQAAASIGIQDSHDLPKTRAIKDTIPPSAVPVDTVSDADVVRIFGRTPRMHRRL